jgi:DnaJ-class molecular chaperone
MTPVYEKCDRCGGSGPYGYKRCHTCYPKVNEDEVSLVDYDNADYDLYWADDQEHDY